MLTDEYVEGCAKPLGYLPGCFENGDGSVDCYCYEQGCNTREMIDNWILENHSSKTMSFQNIQSLTQIKITILKSQ